MPFLLRPRRAGARVTRAALTCALLAAASACGQYPNSVFHGRTDFNRDTNWLFMLIIILGTVVFVFVEGLMLWVMWKYRSHPGQKEAVHVHGNTTLEIAWTAIPALILMVIAVPTVKSIFRTQAPARADALQVEVTGHQWWWEFRYPQYGFVTANELYLPLGRTVNFKLMSADVIHSFWIPAMGGKRDLMANRTNYLWFTPDSTTADAWNGVCVEFCGASHANMRFKAFTVSPQDFESWAAHQKTPATMLGPAPAAPGAGAPAGTPAAVAPAAAPTLPAAQQPLSGPTPLVQAGFIGFARDRIPAHVVPDTPIPAEIPVDGNLTGDPVRGEALFKGPGTCFACHVVTGPPGMSIGTIGPNLTHIASRSTIGAGLFQNDTKHLTAWISNAPLMKPGITMPTILKGQISPTTKKPAGLLDAQQVADIVAYLQTLK
jgi:cytochrome c oxidase subunit 2